RADRSAQRLPGQIVQRQVQAGLRAGLIAEVYYFQQFLPVERVVANQLWSQVVVYGDRHFLDGIAEKPYVGLTLTDSDNAGIGRNPDEYILQHGFRPAREVPQAFVPLEFRAGGIRRVGG